MPTIPTRQQRLAINEAEELYKMYKANGQLEPRTLRALSLSGEGMTIDLVEGALTITYASGRVAYWADGGS